MALISNGDLAAKISMMILISKLLLVSVVSSSGVVLYLVAKY
jgi:hypothetical protein